MRIWCAGWRESAVSNEEEVPKIPKHSKAGVAFAGVDLGDAWLFLVGDCSTMMSLLGPLAQRRVALP